MVSWPPEWQQKIIDALTKVGADRVCPRCGHEDFNLLDGYIGVPLQGKLREGPTASVSTVATVCERCGYLSQHVLSVLLASDIDEEGGPSGNA